jgi:hypothetical protein
VLHLNISTVCHNTFTVMLKKDQRQREGAMIDLVESPFSKETQQDEEGETIENLSLFPSDSILKCNGQDISRKGGKAKSLMIVLPADLSFMKNTDGDFAYLENLNSSQPQLVVDVEGGVLRFKGKFVETRSAFLSIDIQPTKKQSICNDLTTRVLIFEAPSFNGTPCGEEVVAPAAAAAAAAAAASGALETGRDAPLPPPPVEKETDESLWLQHFGCSAEAQPRAVKSSASQRCRLSVSSSTTFSASQSQSSAKKEIKNSSSCPVAPESDSEGARASGKTRVSVMKKEKTPVRKRTGGGSAQPNEQQPEEEGGGRVRRTGTTRKRSRVSYVESSSGGESEEEDDEEEDGGDSESQESSWDDE